MRLVTMALPLNAIWLMAIVHCIKADRIVAIDSFNKVMMWSTAIRAGIN